MATLRKRLGQDRYQIELLTTPGNHDACWPLALGRRRIVPFVEVAVWQIALGQVSCRHSPVTPPVASPALMRDITGRSLVAAG